MSSPSRTPVLACLLAGITGSMVLAQSVPPVQLPAQPVFTRAYDGASSGNQNRKWCWTPGEGGGPTTDYWVVPDWLPAGFATSKRCYLQADASPTARLAPGLHTVTVRARNAAGMGPPAADIINVIYTNPESPHPSREMGVAGALLSCPSGSGISDIVGFRYRFHIAENSGQGQTIKIVFGGHRLVGPDGAAYSMEEDLMTERFVFRDPICDHTGPLEAPRIMSEASVRVDISDYVEKGQTGIKTFSPKTFPRHMNLQIDNTPGGTSRRETISQVLIDKKDIAVEISRGPIVTDKSGWKCDRLLDEETYRQWDVSLTIDGTEHRVAITLPEKHGRFLDARELFNPRTEFFLYPGYMKVFYWDTQIRREDSADWEPVEVWKVTEFDGYPVDYGIRQSTHGGHPALEISNDAPGVYLPKESAFSVPAPSIR